MTELPHPDVQEIDMLAVLHALSDRTRFEIAFNLARDGERACGSFEDLHGLTGATLSHHFRVLREAGVTRTRFEGGRRLVRLREDDLQKRFPGLLDAVLATEPARA
jgi:DNA-binding transcriptional ArsR family regulator